MQAGSGALRGALGAWRGEGADAATLAALAGFAGVAVPTVVATVAIRLGARRTARAREAREGQGAQVADPVMVWRVLRRLLQPSAERRRSFGLMALLFVALLAANACAVAQSFAQRDFMSALASRDAELFTDGLRRAFLLLAVGMPTRCLAEFATGGLGIAWRDILTNGLMEEYFHPKTVYWLRRDGEIRDPDTRIAVEAGHFADAAVLMVRDIFENVMKLSAFIGIVMTIRPFLCAVMAGYALFGAFATLFIFGRPLVKLDRGIRAQEASFRGALARCRDRAEALVLSGGEAAEAAASGVRYRGLRQRAWSRVRWRTGLASFRDCFGWAAYLLPIALVAPMWLRGEVEFGVISQVVVAFNASLDALTVVVRKFRSVSSLIAEGSRLEGLAAALARYKGTSCSPPVILDADSQGLDVDGLTLRLPNGTALCDGLTFSLGEGQRMMIFGQSGAGKTTIIRALAGLWFDGKGSVRRAESASFLSQEPYLPEDTLRAVLTFPAPPGSFTDEEILAAARGAQLGRVLERHKLDAVEDWEAVLSRGEQQRCCFCRVLLFRPALVVLDEATAAVDVKAETALYAALKASTVVTVSHRLALSELHTHMLRKDSQWVFGPVEQWAAVDAVDGVDDAPDGCE